MRTFLALVVGIALGAAAVHADAFLGAALREAAPGGQRLHQRHVALEPHGSGALHLAVDVDLRLPVDPDHVAIADQQVSLVPASGEQIARSNPLSRFNNVLLPAFAGPTRNTWGNARLGITYFVNGGTKQLAVEDMYPATDFYGMTPLLLKEFVDHDPALGWTDSVKKSAFGGKMMWIMAIVGAVIAVIAVKMLGVI